MSPDATSAFEGSSLSERLEFRGQVRSSRKLMVQDFLNPMIGTGAERSEYDDLVKDFTEMFESEDAFSM